MYTNKSVRNINAQNWEDILSNVVFIMSTSCVKTLIVIPVLHEAILDFFFFFFFFWGGGGRVW